ncbi:hypothetical protein JOQ06_005591, partial [Pogonophryne albipinna]
MEGFLGGWGPGRMVCQSPQRTRWAAVTRQTGQRGAQNGLVRSAPFIIGGPSVGWSTKYVGSKAPAWSNKEPATPVGDWERERMLSGKLTETLEWWTSFVIWRLLGKLLGGEDWELGGEFWSVVAGMVATLVMGEVGLDGIGFRFGRRMPGVHWGSGYCWMEGVGRRGGLGIEEGAGAKEGQDPSGGSERGQVGAGLGCDGMGDGPWSWRLRVGGEGWLTGKMDGGADTGRLLLQVKAWDRGRGMICWGFGFGFGFSVDGGTPPHLEGEVDE